MVVVGLLLCFVQVALSGPVTEHCCLPRQFTATVMENGVVQLPTGPTAIDYFSHITFDIDKMMMRMDRDGYVHNKPDSQTMFNDYKANRTYFYNKDRFCSPMHVATVPPVLCFSDSSYHFEGRHHFGSKDHNIISDAWSTTLNGNINMTFYVTEDCTPVTQIIIALENEYPSQSIWTYTKFQHGVKPELLTLPANCHP
ncbi:uncharacterized protein [Argopecten irradians]|uniref:uncharacterized protein n=1 Tax=Argopecten irradians TaxID=31199 RepID=UPI003718E0BF